VLRLAPPLVIDEAELDAFAAELIRKAGEEE
jgi:4-aminobutyrate aminotransferase-like enzyme